MSAVQVGSKIHPLYGAWLTLCCRDGAKRWKNVQGQSKGIRTHLDKEHGTVWRTAVFNNKLKGWQTIRATNGYNGGGPSGTNNPQPEPCEPFTIAGFYDRLIRWITVDDQVCISLHTCI